MTDPIARLRPALTVLEGVVMVVGGEVCLEPEPHHDHGRVHTFGGREAIQITPEREFVLADDISLQEEA